MTRQTNPFGYSPEMLSLPCGRPLGTDEERWEFQEVLKTKREAAIAWMEANNIRQLGKGEQ